jgi:microsomal epoxide hydrolase
MVGQVNPIHGKKILLPCADVVSMTGSPLEFLGLLDLAKAKYSDSDLPYTFIVPSLPGYGFSGTMSTKVLGTCEYMAYVVDQLMAGLGFADRYFAQGGDIGGSSTCEFKHRQ